MSAVRVRHLREGALDMLVDTQRVAQPGAWLFDAQHFAGAAGTQALQAGRGSVHFIDIDGAACVLRHYRRGGLPGKLVRSRYVWPGLTRTRPWREFLLLQTLRAAGLPVPAPVAAGIWRSGVHYGGAIVMQRLADVRTLRDILADGPVPAATWRDIGALVAALHGRGVHHPDLNVTNLLIGADGRVSVVDFDRAGDRAPRWLLALGLARLRRSLRKQQRAMSDGGHYDDADNWAALREGYRSALG